MKQTRLGKRIAAWLMCLAMVLTTINLPAFTTEVKAAKITDEIDGINYTFDGTNYTAVVVKKESGYAGDIIIPETVSYNGKEYTVTEIGSGAFYGCTGLTTIEIPDKVEIIYSGAFYNCSGLKNISMPCRLRTLKDLSIPEGVEVTYRHLDGATESCSDVIYSYERFYTGRVWYKLACNGVLNITGFGTGYVGWDDTLDEALSKNEVKEIIISDVYKVDVNAFIDFRNLTSVTIGENIEAIGENAFSGCNKLSSIVIPESVETIGSGVFEGCTGLRSISMPCRFRTAEDLAIPDDVEITYTHVSDEAAASCEAIVDSGITDDGLYYELTCNGTLTISGAGDISSLKWLGTDIKTVIIEEGVTGIGVMAFQNCSNLSSITIPGTVNNIGYRAFYNCSKLSEIVIPNGVRHIGESTFAECPSLINVTIPDTVESIDDSAFEECINLGSIYIPDSVTSIRWGAFKDCPSLKNITIPSSVISLGNSVFSGCTSLESITIPSSISSISQSAFEGCTKLNSVTISDDVTSIDSGAFKGCTSLESITIPHSIAIIGYEAFAGCSKLKNVTIANGVNIIEGMAFRDCIGLTKITIPNSVREMFSGAFSGCTNINSATMPCKFATSDIDFGFPSSANITYVHDFSDDETKCKVCDICKLYATTGNHDFSKQPYIADNDGKHHQKCKYCGATSKSVVCTEFTTANENVVAPTCGKAGSHDVVTRCKDCKQAIKTEHKVDAATGKHTGGKATCTSKAVCSVCKQSYGSLAAHTEKATITKATLTANGKITYTCSTCAKTTKTTVTINYPKTITTVASAVYSGSQIKPAVTVKDANGTVIPATSYTLTYGTNKDVGAGSVTVTFKGNYSGTKKLTFKINPKATGISSLTNASSGVTIKWAKNASATGYKLYRSVNGGSYTLLKTITSNATVSYTDTTATTNGAKYQYKMVAYKTVSGTTYTSTYSAVKTIYRVKAVGVSSLANAATGITVKWAKNDKATGYKLYRSVNGGAFSLLKTVTSNATVSYTDTKATTNGAKYQYKIIAYKTVGGTTYTSTYSGAKTCYRLSRPAISSATNSAAGKVTVKWNKNDKASGYKIKYTVGTTTKTVKVTSAATVSKVLSSLTKGKTYSISVQSYKTVGSTTYYSAWSAAKSVKITK